MARRGVVGYPWGEIVAGNVAVASLMALPASWPLRHRHRRLAVAMAVTGLVAFVGNVVLSSVTGYALDLDNPKLYIIPITLWLGYWYLERRGWWR